MSEGTRRDYRHAVVLAVVAILWTAFFVARYAYSLYDDAYIYLRYAQNVLGGCGLRFNCADAPVEGFTSPLYLGLLVAGGFAGFGEDLETLTQLLGLAGVAAALCAAGLAAGQMASEALPEQPALRRWWLPLGVLVSLGGAGHFMLNSVIGLETALGCLVVTLIFASSLKENLPGMRTLLVLAVLTRPETVLFIPMVLVFPHARQWRFWPPLVAGVAAVVVWRYAVFADIAPNTYWAKAGGTAAHLHLGIEYLLELIRDFPLVLLAPLALLHPGARRSVAFFGITALLWCAFFLKSGGDTFGYSRLAVPLVPGLVAMAFVGLALAFDKLSRIRAIPRRSAVVAVLVAVVAVGSGLYGHTLYGFDQTQHGFDNVQKWTQVGLYLRKHHPEASVATVPIGAIGYFSGSPRVLDLVGLTSREVAKAGRSVPTEKLGRHWIGHERHNTEWIIEQAPDLIVYGKWAAAPLRDPSQARAGFYADWLLLRGIKEGRYPYVLYMPQVAPGVYWQMFVRRDLVE